MDYFIDFHTVWDLQYTLQTQTLPNLAVQLPLVVQRLQRFQVLLKDGNVWLQEGLPVGLQKDKPSHAVEKTESERVS